MGRKYYTSEEKLAAVKLYIKYDFSPSAVIYELGYPSRNRLYSWYKEYKETGKFSLHTSSRIRSWALPPIMIDCSRISSGTRSSSMFRQA